ANGAFLHSPLPLHAAFDQLDFGFFHFVAGTEMHHAVALGFVVVTNDGQRIMGDRVALAVAFGASLALYEKCQSAELWPNDFHDGRLMFDSGPGLEPAFPFPLADPVVELLHRLALGGDVAWFLTPGATGTQERLYHAHR